MTDLRHQIATLTIDDQGHRNSELQQVLVAGYQALKWALPLQAADETLTAIADVLHPAQGTAEPVAWAEKYLEEDSQVPCTKFYWDKPKRSRATVEIMPLYAAQPAPVQGSGQWLELADYLERLEGDLLANDADAIVSDNTPPSVWADRIRKAVLPAPHAALREAEAAFEFIRLKLINHLEEPERSAFWKAVAARDAVRAALQPEAPDPGMDARLRSSGPAEQSDSGTWTAGIDAMRSYPFQDTQWHLHAIEFHHKVREEAEALRDRWLAASSRPSGQMSREEKNALTKIAAECHRTKWQFDFNEESAPAAREARKLVLRAFDALHRIGDLALRFRDETSSPSPGVSISKEPNHD